MTVTCDTHLFWPCDAGCVTCQLCHDGKPEFCKSAASSRARINTGHSGQGVPFTHTFLIISLQSDIRFRLAFIITLLWVRGGTSSHTACGRTARDASLHTPRLTHAWLRCMSLHVASRGVAHEHCPPDGCALYSHSVGLCCLNAHQFC